VRTQYKYLGSIQGASVVRGVRDGAGRPGTGLLWTSRGAKEMLIFDSRTLAYLGGKSWEAGRQPDSGLSESLLRQAIVDRPGQLPG
jgi:hypothetical protein